MKPDNVLFALAAIAANFFQPSASERPLNPRPDAPRGKTKLNCVARNQRAARKAKNIKRHRRACRG